MQEERVRNAFVTPQTNFLAVQRRTMRGGFNNKKKDSNEMRNSSLAVNDY